MAKIKEIDCKRQNEKQKEKIMNKKNRLWYTKNSKIHGIGLFANIDIQKKSKIIEYIGEKISADEGERRYQELKKNASDKDGTVYIFGIDDDISIDGNVSENYAKFANHSCDPNCESQNIEGKIYFVALRDIKKDEEVTLDYGFDKDELGEHKCKCGAQNCAGYIISAELRDEVCDNLK